MSQSDMDKNLSCGNWENLRKDWISADIVERGIEMQTDKGYGEAVKYLQKYNIDRNVIERVLVNRLDRRAQISGSL